MNSKNQQLNKAAIFTDLHIGRRGGGVHNQDCKDYISWFCFCVKQDPSIDHIIFLGDWHQNRNSIGIDSLDDSLFCGSKLNDLELPVFFIIGNHDLFYRHNRSIFSTKFLKNFSNFVIVDHPAVFKNLGPTGALLTPFLFHHEYEELLPQFFDVPVWFGHFEFKDFVIAGHTTRMQVGPDPKQYTKPKWIFSGHYHKRQAYNNIIYVGSCFPYDFSDANDTERGFATYDYINDNVDFVDWDQAPSFHKLPLSVLLDQSNDGKFNNKSRIQCIVDLPVTYEEINVIKTTFLEQNNVREITFDDTSFNSSKISQTELNDDIELQSTEEFIVEALSTVQSETIDTQLLVQIYNGL